MVSLPSGWRIIALNQKPPAPLPASGSARRWWRSSPAWWRRVSFTPATTHGAYELAAVDATQAGEVIFALLGEVLCWAVRCRPVAFGGVAR